VIEDIFAQAKKYHREMPREILAHQLSAESHRHRNMLLGGCATVLTTLMGTAVFTGLVSHFGLDGKSNPSINPFQVKGGIFLYGIVLVFSILAPVLSALHSFMHNAEDAASHQSSAVGYCRVHSLLTIFLAKYEPNTSPDKIDEALNAYDGIMKEYESTLAKSIPLHEAALDAADEAMGNPKKSKSAGKSSSPPA
jgi:hypothetical protein